MSYQTIHHHHDAPQNDEKLRLISVSQRLSWKTMITPNDAMFQRKWLSCVLRVTLISFLAISGCNFKNSGEDSGGQSKLTQQGKGNAASNPIHKEVGEASWYGPGLHGKETANGETFNQKEMTAAHPSLPMGTKAKVTNLENGKKVEVRINDRGPYSGDRAIDLSSGAAKKIDMKEDGTTKVRIETKAAKKNGSVNQSGKTK